MTYLDEGVEVVLLGVLVAAHEHHVLEEVGQPGDILRVLEAAHADCQAGSGLRSNIVYIGTEGGVTLVLGGGIGTF